MSAAMLLDALSPKFAEAQQVQDGRRAARDVVGRVPVAAGQRQGARLPGPAGEGGRQEAAGDPRRPREPRPQPAHRRHRAAPRPRRLHGVRARRAVPARRLPGRRGQGARRCSRRSIRRRRARTSSPRPAGCRRGPTHRQDRRGRLLLWRRRSSTCWRRACPSWPPPSRSTAARRRSRTCRRSRRRCCCTSPRTTSASTRAWPPYEAALKAAGTWYEAYIYPGTQHGFNNDTTPRYDEKNAKLAWERTMAHFARHVKG